MQWENEPCRDQKSAVCGAGDGIFCVFAAGAAAAFLDVGGPSVKLLSTFRVSLPRDSSSIVVIRSSYSFS